jgi:hypothetical protein
MRRKTLTLPQSVALSLVVSALSMGLYRAAFEAPAAQQVVIVEAAPVVCPAAPTCTCTTTDTEPEQAEPSFDVDDGDEGKTAFAAAVDLLREHEDAEGCRILRATAGQFPDSIWGEKAMSLHSRRCTP